jgi:hypothetical protein
VALGTLTVLPKFHRFREAIDFALKNALDRTQPSGAGTKAKVKMGEVLTTEGTEGTEEDRMFFLCVLCALCGLALLMLPSFLSVSQIRWMARRI